MDEPPTEIVSRPASPANLGGRPSLYRPEYCEMAIAHMSTGASITSFAGEIDVSRRTLTKWAHEHPDFAHAIEIGKAKLAAWWEKRARTIADGGGGPGAASMCQFAMKNLAPEDWQDRSTTEHVGRIGHFPMTAAEALAEAQRRGLPTQVYEP